MADSVKKNTVVYVTAETTEGTYVAPATGSDAVQTLADGLEMSPGKELIDRNIARGGIGKVAGRAGKESVTATIPVEMKAGPTSGSEPEYGLLMEACLGAKRSVASPVTASVADGATGSASQVPFANADKNKYAVDSVVRIRHSGADHIVRITEVSNTDGAVSITVEPPLASGSFGAGDTVSAVTTYYAADSGHKTLSVTKEIEGNMVEVAKGCRVSSMSVNNFSTGQIADFSFSLAGLSFDRSIGGTGLAPSFDSSEPPLILDAKVFINGAEVEVNEVSISCENTVAMKTATGAPKGNVSSRITERAVSGSFNPYKQDDDLTFYDKYNSGDKFDLMLYAYNPASVASQKEEIVAIVVTGNVVTELGESDQDGLLQENVSFQSDGANIFVSVI